MPTETQNFDIFNSDVASKILANHAHVGSVIMLDDVDSVFCLKSSCLVSVILTVLDSLNSDNKHVTVFSTSTTEYISELVCRSYRFGSSLTSASLSVGRREFVFMRAFICCELKLTYDLSSQTLISLIEWKEIIQHSVKGLAAKVQGSSIGEITGLVNKGFYRFRARFLPVKSLFNAALLSKFALQVPKNTLNLSKQVLFGLSGIKRRLLSSLYAPYKCLENLLFNSVREKIETFRCRRTGRPCSGLSVT